MKNINISLLFLVIGIVLFIGLFQLGVNYNNPWKGRIKIIKDILDNPLSTDALIFGSSHANCIDLKTLGFKGKLLAGPGQDLFEASYQIRFLVKKLPNLKAVFISMSYFSFYFDNAALIHNGISYHSGKRRAVYASIPSWHFIDNDFQNFIYGKVFPIFTNDNWETVITGVLNDFFSLKEPESAIVGKKVEEKEVAWKDLSAEERRENGKRRVKSLTNWRMGNMKKNHPAVEEDSFRALCLAIEALQNHKVKVVLVKTPCSYEYETSFDPFYKKILADNINKLIFRYNVEYYNFSNDSAFLNHPEYLFNSDHLNKLGKTLFNKKLLEAMKL